MTIESGGGHLACLANVTVLAGGHGCRKENLLSGNARMTQSVMPFEVRLVGRVEYERFSRNRSKSCTIYLQEVVHGRPNKVDVFNPDRYAAFAKAREVQFMNK